MYKCLLDKEPGSCIKCRNSTNEKGIVIESKSFPQVRKFIWLFQITNQLDNIKYNILEDQKSVYITLFSRKHAALKVVHQSFSRFSFSKNASEYLQNSQEKHLHQSIILIKILALVKREALGNFLEHFHFEDHFHSSTSEMVSIALIVLFRFYFRKNEVVDFAKKGRKNVK